jgi:hypothetical protein
MALNLRRWLLIVGVGFAAIAVSLLPPRPPRRYEPRMSVAMQFRDLYQVESRLREARTELARARLRQWVEQEITTESLPGGTAPLVIPRGASDSTRAMVAARIERLWQSVGPLDRAIRTVVLLVEDSSYRVPSGQFLLPTAENRGHCVAVLSAQRYERRMNSSLVDQQMAEDLGVCMLYARHGFPGAHVERWFRGGGVNYGTWYDLPGDTDHDEELIPSRFSFRDAVFADWEVYSGSLKTAECRGGKLDTCAEIILERDSVVGDTTHAFTEPTYQWRRRLGSGSAGLLSDLRREMGEDRFSRFWHSERPAADAFQDAFGLSAGEWTYRWLQNRTAGFRAGPAPGTYSLLTAGGLTLVFFGLALVVGGRSRLGK